MALLCALVFATSNAFAEQYQWQVHFPKGLAGAKCHIFARTASGDRGETVMNEGDTWKWQSTVPLTFIDGWCEDYPGGMISASRLLSRTCDGTDFSTSARAVKCTNDVSLQICMKGNGKAGFCPR
jgi:hypothetical protein